MRERMGLGIGVALTGATLLVVTLMYVAAALSVGAFAPWRSGGSAVRWDEVAKISLPAAALIAAVVAGVIAAYGHQARLDELALSRDSDVTDRYTRAVEQLGNGEQLAVRLGGVYALERIHHDSERDRSTITNLLQTFAITNAERRRGPAGDPNRPPRADVEAALQALGRLNTPGVNLADLSLVSINLTGAKLPDCRLISAELSRAVLRGADLWRAKLTGADLKSARLIDANLTDAVLSDANLTGAFMAGADLTGARLRRANLTGAHLRGAKLIGAQLTGAKLTGADLAGARLTGANLTGANLTDVALTAVVDLTGVDLTDVDLTGVDLTGVDLTDANLTRVDLTDANLTEAHLTRVDLSDAKLTGANLTGVELDATRWATDLPPTTDWPHLVTLIDQRQPTQPAGT